MVREWMDVELVVCKPSVEDPFRIDCIIEDKDTGRNLVKNLYGFVARDVPSIRREVNTTSFYFPESGYGYCIIRDWELLDRTKVKILDCRLVRG